MTEQWRAGPGFPGYDVSDLGRVRSWRTTQGVVDMERPAKSLVSSKRNKYGHGTKVRGEDHPLSKLVEPQVVEILDLLATRSCSQKEIAETLMDMKATPENDR